MSDPIEALLAETELDDDLVLRELLGEIEREATSVRPLPSAALREAMGAGQSRRGRVAGRTGVVIGVAVIGVLGLGVGAAAASPDARSAIGAGVAAIARLFHPAPGAQTPPAPDVVTSPPRDADSPSPSPSPDPPSPSATPSPSSSEHGSGSDDSKGGGSGSDSGSTHGNGKGNQSGHGNGKGRGNGGPAPTP
jgi:hypothetical protein